MLERRLRSGRLALRDALPELDTQIVPLDSFLLANVNTREDLVVAERRRGALEAALTLGRAHGTDVEAPRILQDWNDTIVHLAPARIVARVRTSWLDGDAEATFAREVAVAEHAAVRSAPIVRPTRSPPPGTMRMFIAAAKTQTRNFPDPMPETRNWPVSSVVATNIGGGGRSPAGGGPTITLTPLAGSPVSSVTVPEITAARAMAIATSSAVVVVTVVLTKPGLVAATVCRPTGADGN